MILTASGSCLYTSLGVGYLAMAVVLIGMLSGLTPEDDTLQPRQRTYVPQFWQLHNHALLQLAFCFSPAFHSWFILVLYYKAGCYYCSKWSGNALETHQVSMTLYMSG